MRTIALTLGLSLLVSAAPGAQAPASQLSLLPPHTPTVSVDFGLVKARMRLPQGLVFVQPPSHAPRQELPFSQWRQMLTLANPAPAMDCAMVISHRHDVMPAAMPMIRPSPDTRHHLKVVTVPPCPVR